MNFVEFDFELSLKSEEVKTEVELESQVIGSMSKILTVTTSKSDRFRVLSLETRRGGLRKLPRDNGFGRIPRVSRQ